MDANHIDIEVSEIEIVQGVSAAKGSATKKGAEDEIRCLLKGQRDGQTCPRITMTLRPEDAKVLADGKKNGMIWLRFDFDTASDPQTLTNPRLVLVTKFAG